jgi:hypothetical protein
MKHIKQWHQNLESNVSWYRKWHEGEFHKIIHFGILIFSVLFTILLIVSSTNVKAIGTTYYVSSTGSDSNNGTSTSTPWQTLTKVNNTTFVAGDKILFKAGDTFTGTIIPKASGTSSNPITYGMYGTGAKPVITGFASVSGWTSLGGNKWESAALSSAFSDINILYINGGNYAKGRTPDTGYWASTSATYTKSSNVGTITDTVNLNASSNNWTGAQVVFRSQRWVLDKAKITAASTNKITFNGEPSTAPGWGYFIQNDPRTLNLTNEWSYDSASKKITIYSTATPNNVKAPAVDVAVNLSNQDYITFDGIDFNGFNSTGINTTSSTGITVTNSDFSFIGVDAIYAYPNSVNLKVTNNTFSEINSRGIHGGSSDNAFISNNTLNKIGNMAGMGSNGDDSYTGIISMGDNGIVSLNSVVSAGYVGIRWDGRSTQILNNLVNTTNYIKDDGGGIYSYPQQDGTAYTTRYAGYQRKVANNIVLNSVGAVAGGEPSSTYSQGEGIYADGLSPNIDFINNTIYKAKLGLFINGGHEILAKGNTVYDTERGINFMAIPDQNNVQQRAHDVSLQDNILVARDSSSYTEYPMYLELKASTLATWMGGFLANNNVYARVRASNDPKLIWLDVNSGSDIYKSLAEWKSFSGQDANSTESPVALTTSTNLLFDYATFTDKPINLSAGYVNMKGIVQPCTLTVPAWSSVIMIKTGATCTGTTAPTVSLTAPLNTTPVTAVEGTQFQVSASTTGTGITSVAFYLDGTTTLLPGCTPNPDTTSSYGCIWNTTAVSDGTHTITAKVSTATTSAISSVVTVNVQNGGGGDTTAPTFQPASSLTTPSANTSVPVGTTYTISATATDNVAMSKVEFYKDGVIVNTDTTGPGSLFSYDWNTTGLTVGSTHSWTAKAYDTATPANVSTTTARVITIGAAPDTTPPTVTLTAPTGSYYRPGATITIKATATDNIGVSKVEFYVDDVLKCTDATSSYTCSWKVPSSPIGSFSIKAIAYDAATNNTSSILKKVKNTKLTVPTSSVNAGPDQTITLPTNSVTLNGSYTSGLSLENVSTWSRVSGSGTITDPSNVVTTITGLTAGTSVFKLSLNDGTTTVSDTVSIIVNPAPSTSKFTFTNLRSNETSGTTTVLVDVASTVGATITKVEFFVDTTKIGEDLTYNTYSTTWDTTAFLNGDHSITARATDSLGNAETSSAVVVNVTN